jgi:hypothetical protein
LIDRLTQKRERHGLPLSLYIGTTPLDRRELWQRLDLALDLIAAHSPQWLRRMRAINNSIHIRRIPGNRARLAQGQRTILDPYLLANFPPAQVAASIVHEATHAMLRYRQFRYDPAAPAREERACRRSELRLGQAMQAAGVAGADAVVERARAALAMRDADVGVVVDWKAMKILETVTLINELPLPRWARRLIAQQRGVLNTPQGRAAFGAPAQRSTDQPPGLS